MHDNHVAFCAKLPKFVFAVFCSWCVIGGLWLVSVIAVCWGVHGTSTPAEEEAQSEPTGYS